MKTILISLLTLWLAAIACALGWFFFTFTVFRAAEGEGFLVLYDKEARECAITECAVYSESEFREAVGKILHGIMLRQQQSLRSRT